jgi:hypothetical protein
MLSFYFILFLNANAITTVSREGLAPIVKAYSRLIPVDGLVL